MNGPWKWTNGPCPIHLHAKIMILMGNLEFDGAFGKMMGSRNLYIYLTAKWTSDLNSLCMGLSQKWSKNCSITHSFFHEMVWAHPRNIPAHVRSSIYIAVKRLLVGKSYLSDQFKKIIKRYIRVGYNLNVMRQSACLVLNPITVYSYGFLFNS